jgi:predicted nucleic acid-binding protein
MMTETDPIRRWATDSNILLRITQPGHPMHAEASQATGKLLESGEVLSLFPQNIREFWNVATHPTEKNGLGMTPARAGAEVRKIEFIFPILEDGLPTYHEWLQIVITFGVSGVQVHDASLIAAMRVHGLTELLTFNVTDFTRYAALLHNHFVNELTVFCGRGACAAQSR